MKLFDVLFESLSAKLLLLTPAVAAVASQTSINHVTTPFIGTSIVTFVSALIGAGCAYAQKGDPNRYKMFGGIVVFAILGCVAVTLLPWYLERTVPEPLQAPLALALAFACRFLVPVLTEYGPGWVRGWMSTKVPPAPKGEA
jgi:hypothetical protein